MKTFLMVIYIFLSQIVLSQIQIDADFENGNVEVLSIVDSTNTITIIPSLETAENTTRCWFYFRVYNFDLSKELTINIDYINSVMAPINPVYSYDKIIWTKIPAFENMGVKQISTIFLQDTVYFATGFPYTYSDLNNYISKIKDSKCLKLSVLTKSENGNNVPKLTITNQSVESPKQIIWIIARQHAFETHSNYIVEGMIDYFLTKSKEMERLNKICEIHIVPMIDVDNVIIGASGRMQTPVDFNRDWNIKSHWNAVNELKKVIPQSIENNNYSMFWDIHSTYPGGTTQLYSYFDIYMNTKESENLNNFWDIYQDIAKIKPIRLNGLESEKGYKWADQYNGTKLSTDSASTYLRATDFSTTLECEWNLRPDGVQWTIENIKNEGKNIGESICKYILEKDKLTKK